MPDAVSILIVICLAGVWYGVLNCFVRPAAYRAFERERPRHAGFVPIPVIFANGRDDDTDGFIALYYNQPVIVGNDLIPTDTGLTKHFRKVCVRWPGLEIFQDGASVYRSHSSPRFRIDIPGTARAISVKWDAIEYGHIVHEQDN